VNFLRVGFAVAGFALALISIALDHDRLGWAAIALLLLSVLTRLTLRKRMDSSPREPGSDDRSSV